MGIVAPPILARAAAVAQLSLAGSHQRSAAAVAFTSAMEVPAAARCGGRRRAVADTWRHLQGCDDWEGMLGPDLQGPAAVLRSEVARYGELVQACYKAFDLDRASPRYLNSRYGKASMFKEVGMADAGYDVTAYVYASPDVMTPIMEAHISVPGRWIGYVAVSTDDMTRRLGRRDLLVSFRGTVTPNEWMSILKSSLVPARLDPCHPRPDVLVESGFLSLYTSADKTCRFGGPGSCREQLLREVPRLIDASTSEDVSVIVAGHSMGSALGLLLAYDLAELGLTRGATVTVFSFGGPRVGNVAFKERCGELGVKVLRVTNVHDPITKVPGILLNEATTAVLRPWRASCYTHVGVELPLHLFSLVNPACIHEMETYVALLRRSL